MEGTEALAAVGEEFFHELVDLGGVTRVERQTFAGLCQRYGLEMDSESVPGLLERFGLRFPDKLKNGRCGDALGGSYGLSASGRQYLKAFVGSASCKCWGLPTRTHPSSRALSLAAFQA